MELFRVVTLAEARRLLARYWPLPGRQEVILPLLAALGRELARPVAAKDDVPGFTRATMDGYAVRAADTFGARESQPVILNLVGEVPMGQPAAVAVGPGEAVAVATGSMMPPGADAVVMVENTEVLAEGRVAVFKPVAPGQDLVRQGADVRAGTTVLPAGHTLRPQDLGVLASLGVTRVTVYEPWRVGILATGNEIVPPEADPGPGQVRDINSYTLAGLVQECGGKVTLYGIAPDDLESLTAIVKTALAENHLVLLSGGSSVGTRDLTVQVLAGLGQPGILFHGVAIRPGKPTVAAVAGDKMILGLPGHPVSAMVVFSILIEPLLRYGSYDHPAGRRTVEAILSRTVTSIPGREDYIRVRLEAGPGGFLAVPVPGGSSMISSMVQADGLVTIPLEEEGLEAGTRVEVKLF
ncbi:Molybdenum cofactor synthesis [Moorella glycerini]|uniref:Molybdopterin molybdenumtransferase n=1 Tax=Neomoorella stamsii TaxID=1266720 RepID=A0A9X7J4K2_9FIRM|nr:MULTISPECIES: gephyrin-like molybdotransferase Glp [Moorella]PRR73468.1 Molybdopterin molybdenumtransferase [Moorella stamsii]CEP69237.1 Molybdenum cofactor synthesis [Moorella glycerini]